MNSAAQIFFLAKSVSVLDLVGLPFELGWVVFVDFTLDGPSGPNVFVAVFAFEVAKVLVLLSVGLALASHTVNAAEVLVKILAWLGGIEVDVLTGISQGRQTETDSGKQFHSSANC